MVIKFRKGLKIILVGKNIPLIIYESEKDSQTSGLSFVNNVGALNPQIVDEFAGEVKDQFVKISESPNLSTYLVNYMSDGFYNVSIDKEMNNGNVYIFNFDKTNNVTENTIIINNKKQAKLKTVNVVNGTLRDFNISEIMPEYDYYFKFNNNVFSLQNNKADYLGNKTEDYFASKEQLKSHAEQIILDHPDNSVIDTKIGKRSIGKTNGLLQELFTLIGNIIKSITGVEEWNTSPPVTLLETKAHIDNNNNPHSVTKLQVGLGNSDNTSDINKPVSTAQAAAIKVVQNDLSVHKNDRENHLSPAERNVWNDKYTKVEVDNKLSSLETNIDWKEAVNTFSDIAKAYPTPQDGWTVNTKDTDYTYRYSGTAWIAISANAIPKATTTVDGLQAKENVSAVNANTAVRHTHTNKDLIDDITTVLVNSWNSAFTHISDAIKHITAAERNLWNTVSQKLPLVGGALTGFLTLHSNPTANMHAATKQYVDTLTSGKGDMLKSTYDTNGNGKVDISENSEKVNGLTVLTAVPASAKFTDTTYGLATTAANGLMSSSDKTLLSTRGDMLKSTYDPNNDGIVNLAKLVQIEDTRAIDNPPTFYLKNSAKAVYNEFKQLAIPPYLEKNFYGVSTYTSWDGESGGYPVQIARAKDNGMFYREGISLTQWGNWQKFQMKANENLWDNANLLNPVNQRGLDVYTFDNSNEYCVDRMTLLRGKYTVSTRQLILSPNSTGRNASSFFQYNLFKEIGVAVGDSVTLSAKINGKIYSCTGVIPSPMNGVFSKIDLDVNYNLCLGRWSASDTLVGGIGNIEGKSASGTFILDWFKLEKGSVATEFVPKDYSVEFMACSRYFRRMHLQGIIMRGHNINAVEFEIPLYSPMRIIPSIFVHNPGFKRMLESPDYIVSDGSSTQYGESYADCIRGSMQAVGIIPNSLYTFIVRSYCDISADL